MQCFVKCVQSNPDVAPPSLDAHESLWIDVSCYTISYKISTPPPSILHQKLRWANSGAISVLDCTFIRLVMIFTAFYTIWMFLIVFINAPCLNLSWGIWIFFTFKIYLLNILFNILLYTPKPSKCYCPLKVSDWRQPCCFVCIDYSCKDCILIGSIFVVFPTETRNTELWSTKSPSRSLVLIYIAGHESWQSSELNQTCAGTSIR
jgi:hypothetical protein